MKGYKKAVAIGYSGKDVPKILAIARGILVESLMEIAEKNNIPVYRDEDLAEVLSAMNTGIDIPVELFKAVAEVLSYCYKINSEFREKIDGMGN